MVERTLTCTACGEEIESLDDLDFQTRLDVVMCVVCVALLEHRIERSIDVQKHVSTSCSSRKKVVRFEFD